MKLNLIFLIQNKHFELPFDLAPALPLALFQFLHQIRKQFNPIEIKEFSPDFGISLSLKKLKKLEIGSVSQPDQQFQLGQEGALFLDSKPPHSLFILFAATKMSVLPTNIRHIGDCSNWEQMKKMVQFMEENVATDYRDTPLSKVLLQGFELRSTPRIKRERSRDEERIRGQFRE